MCWVDLYEGKRRESDEISGLENKAEASQIRLDVGLLALAGKEGEERRNK